MVACRHVVYFALGSAAFLNDLGYGAIDPDLCQLPLFRYVLRY